MVRETLLLLCCCCGMLSAAAQPQTEKFARLMNAYHQYNMFDGAVLVATKGRVVYKGAFGPANREWNIPNGTDTKFMIGSISKPLTAVLTLIQVQKGLVQLDSTIAFYIPEFTGKPAATATIRQLLMHTSGIANYDIIKDFFPRISRQQFSREAYLQIFIDSALAFAPGSQYAYSSWGYFTLGIVLERVSGLTYADLMRRDIFEKLGMRNSGSYQHTQIVANRASGYDYSFGGFTAADFRDQSNTMGTGDIYSTVEDLFLFHQGLTNHTLINEELTRQMFTPGRPPAEYGFGWFNKSFKYSPRDSVASNFHLGMTDGFISFLRRVPGDNSLVVILCNSAPTDFFGITTNLYKLLYQQPVKLREPAHKKMETYIRDLGAQKAVAAYGKLKADTARYYVDWISMNFLAEQLLQLKRLEDARIISENNLHEFGTKDRVLVTMGNIYLALNRKEDAIDMFRKALNITPAYDEARNRLKELGAL